MTLSLPKDFNHGSSRGYSQTNYPHASSFPKFQPHMWTTIKHNQPVVSQMLQAQHDFPKVITHTNDQVSTPLGMPPIPLVTTL